MSTFLDKPLVRAVSYVGGGLASSIEILHELGERVLKTDPQNTSGFESFLHIFLIVISIPAVVYLYYHFLAQEKLRKKTDFVYHTAGGSAPKASAPARRYFFNSANLTLFCIFITALIITFKISSSSSNNDRTIPPYPTDTTGKSQDSAPAKPPSIPKDKKPTPSIGKVYQSPVASLPFGSAYVDEKTGVSVVINMVNSLGSGEGVLQLPGKAVYERLDAGSSWSFVHDGRNYRLTLIEVDPYKEIFKVQVVQNVP